MSENFAKKEEPTINMDEYISVKEVDYILEERKGYTKKIQEKESKISSLQLEIDKINSSNVKESTEKLNKKAIFEALERIKNQTKDSQFDRNTVTISKQELHSLLDRIKQEVEHVYTS